MIYLLFSLLTYDDILGCPKKVNFRGTIPWGPGTLRVSRQAVRLYGWINQGAGQHSRTCIIFIWTRTYLTQEGNNSIPRNKQSVNPKLILSTLAASHTLRMMPYRRRGKSVQSLLLSQSFHTHVQWAKTMRVLHRTTHDPEQLKLWYYLLF